MESKSITLEGNLCNNIYHDFNPFIKVDGQHVNINTLLYEFFYSSEVIDKVDPDSIWRETMDMFRITIERLY